MKEKNVKSIIGIILILLVIVICAVAYAYVKTDLFKTPQQLFKKYLSDNVNELKEVNLKPLDEISKKAKNEALETNFDIDLESNGEVMNVTVNSKADVKNKKQHIVSKVTDEENEYFNLEILSSNNTIGIQIDELHDKYLAIENRDLKKLATTLNLDEETINEIPDRLEFLKSEYSDEDIQKFEYLKDKYLEKIFNKITEDRYRAEKNVQVEVNGNSIKSNKYTLDLTTKEIATIEHDVLTELFSDQEFIDLYKKTGTDDQLEELKKQYIITEEKISEMEDKKVEISVYESNSKTVKTEIICDKNTAEFYINNDNNESTIELSIYEEKNEESEVGERNSIILNNKYENNVGIMTINVNTKYDNDQYEDENYEIVLTTEKQDDNKFLTKISVDGINKLLEDEGVKFAKCEISYNFNNDIKIDDFSEENSLIVNDYSQEDFENLLEELLQNAYNSSTTNPNSLVGILAQYFMLLSSMGLTTY